MFAVLWSLSVVTVVDDPQWVDAFDVSKLVLCWGFFLAGLVTLAYGVISFFRACWESI